MGNISSILAALFCATAPFASAAPQELKTEIVDSNFNLGKERIASIRSQYEKGNYDAFLEQMHASYQEADLTSLIQMRQKPASLEFQEKWESKFLSLQKAKNQELLATLSDRDDSVFAKKVRSISANLLTEDQEKAISKLNSFISLAPGSGKNEDENTLIQLDLEYEYKLMQSEKIDGNLEHQIALRMEKMEKMVAASKNFEDRSLKQAVGMGASTLDARLARNLDGADLNALVKKKQAPKSEVEEKIFSILSSYQGQFADLMKELNQANRS